MKKIKFYEKVKLIAEKKQGKFNFPLINKRVNFYTIENKVRYQVSVRLNLIGRGRAWRTDIDTGTRPLRDRYGDTTVFGTSGQRWAKSTTDRFL